LAEGERMFSGGQAYYFPLLDVMNIGYVSAAVGVILAVSFI
jgi:hypothetical protein